MPQEQPDIADKSTGQKLTADEFNIIKNCIRDNASDAEGRLNSHIDPSWGSSYKGNSVEKILPAFIPRTDDDIYRIFDNDGNEIYTQLISTEADESTITDLIPAIDAALDTLPTNAKVWVVTHAMPHLELAKRTSRPNHEIIIGAINGYGKSGNLDSAGFFDLHGTEDYPITFRALTPGRARITYPSSSRLLRMWQCSHLNFYGIEFGSENLDVVGNEETGGSGPEVFWGVVLGQAYTGESGPDDGQGGELSGISHDLTFEACKVGPVGQALFVIASSSYNIALKYCAFHGSGYRWGRKHNAEGIYIGSGADASQASTAHVCHDIYIKGCEFYDIGRGSSGGEAVDMKNQCYNITVEDCGFNGVNVDNQGCVTVNHGPISPSWTSNGGTVNVLVHRNTFNKVTRRTLLDSEDPNNPPSRTANGVHVGKNGVYVIDNTFLDVEQHNISVELTDGNISGTTGTVLLKGNKPNAFNAVGALTGPPLNVVQE